MIFSFRIYDENGINRSNENKKLTCSETLFEVQEAARAKTACTAIYSPGTLKDSKKISAVYSRFSGALRGGSVYKW